MCCVAVGVCVFFSGDKRANAEGLFISYLVGFWPEAMGNVKLRAIYKTASDKCLVIHSVVAQSRREPSRVTGHPPFHFPPAYVGGVF